MQNPPSVPALLDELMAFATAVARMLTSPDVDWLWRPSGDAWSLTEVVCHLRDVEREVHQPRFRDLIAADNAFLPGATADDWVKARQYHVRYNGPVALQEFLNARQQTFALLDGIRDETLWERRGQHAFFGPTSMHELLYLVVRHDRVHSDQITNLLQYENHQNTEG